MLLEGPKTVPIGQDLLPNSLKINYQRNTLGNKSLLTLGLAHPFIVLNYQLIDHRVHGLNLLLPIANLQLLLYQVLICALCQADGHPSLTHTIKLQQSLYKISPFNSQNL